MPIPSDRTRIIWRLRLRSSPQRVFEFLATDAGRARYWAESAVETKAVIEFVFVNGMKNRSPILESIPGKRFALRYFDSDVQFSLADDGRGGTDMTMVNRGFDVNEYEEILAGWLNVLLPLKAACDFDVDLRSHDSGRTWEQGYVDQ